MPKVLTTSPAGSLYWKLSHSHCLTDGGSRLLEAARSAYRDIAQPSVTEHQDGHVHIYWVTPYRRNTRRPARVLEAVFPPGAAPNDKGTVTCRSLRPGQPITEHGELTLAEMRPLVLELSDHWNRNVWQPTGYRKQDGPYLITVQTASETANTGDTVWRVYRDDRIIKEGTSYGWHNAMRAAEQARNQAAREDKHNRANASRYRAALRSQLIHYPGEPKPDGGQTTLCG